MSNAEKLYAERQAGCGIKKGDIVRVIRKALSNENGWPDYWVSEMDEMVGNVYVVEDVYDVGINLVNPGHIIYHFPYFVLEKVVNMNAKEKSYTERQAECGLKVGDTVRVVRSALDNENGWSCPWVSEMDVMVGNVYKVEIICARGICLRHPNDGTWYHFPYFVLEKVVSMGAEEKAYAERQAKCGIHKGDIVRVVQSALPYVNGWPYVWLPGMDKMIGNIYEVGNVSSSGICLLHPNHITFCFPYFVLEKITAPENTNKSDTPLSPHHYSRWAIEPWDFISANKLDFLTGNVIKYLMRHDEKNGLEDLQKAKVYLEKLIEVNSHAK